LTLILAQTIVFNEVIDHTHDGAFAHRFEASVMARFVRSYRRTQTANKDTR
jgi:hypothetical protein